MFGSFPSPGPPKSDLEYLLENGGAVSCRNLTDFVDKGASETVRSYSKVSTKFSYTNLVFYPNNVQVVICADGTSKSKFQDEVTKIIGADSMTEVKIVNPMWVIDCITNYHIMDLNMSCYSLQN